MAELGFSGSTRRLGGARMALMTILLFLFFILGVAFGPLLLAALIAALDDERSHRLAAFSIGLGLKSIWRPVISFSPSADELTLKRRSYDEKHDTQYIQFGGLINGVKRTLQNPQDRFHSFYGTPFGFVDEMFGVVVDPRDALLAKKLKQHQANGRYEYRVKSGNQLKESVKAVFGTPRGGVGVRLPNVLTLIGGSYDSKFVDRVRDWYETSQSPKSENSGLGRLLVPLAAFFVVVLFGMFAAGQSGGGSAAQPSSGNSTITVGTNMLLLFASVQGLRDGNWRDRGAIAAFLLAGLLLALGLFFAFPMVASPFGIPLPLGIWALILMAVGLVVPAFVASFFGRSLGALGMALGKLYLIIGLLSFDRPVITLTGEGYEVREYDANEWPVEPKWYRFAMSRVGIGFDNDEAIWPEGTTAPASKVQTWADGGKSSGAPAGHSATEAVQVGDIKGFVPDDVDSGAVQVRTDRTTGWFLEVGQDPKLMMTALQSAKRDFGGGTDAAGDKFVLGASLVALLIGAVFDMVVFF